MDLFMGLRPTKGPRNNFVTTWQRLLRDTSVVSGCPTRKMRVPRPGELRNLRNSH